MIEGELIFEYVIMKNYRQFKDAIFYFTIPNGNRWFTVVSVKNGVGKSNLLNAIEKCLYGVEKHLTEKSTAEPIINKQTEKELKIGESCDVILEIFAHDENDNNRRFRFKRVYTFRKSTNGDVTLVPHINANSGMSRFDVLEQDNKDWKAVLNAEDFINELVPEKLSDFFFYDGERLETIFKDESSKYVREQILKISQIAMLDRMAHSVNGITKVFRSESNSLNIKTGSVSKKLNDLEDSKIKQMEMLKKLDDEREYHEREEKKYSDLLGNHKDVKDLVASRNKLEGEIKRIEQNLQDARNQKLGYVTSRSIPILARESIIKTHKIIQGKKDRKEIPRYDKEFLVELQQSICPGCPLYGIDLSKDDNHRNYINNLLRSHDSISELSTELFEVDAFLMTMIDGMKTFKRKLEPFDKNIIRLEEDNIEKSKELEEISRKITKIGEVNNEDDLIFWESKKQSEFGLKRGCEDEIAISKEDIKRTDEKINIENVNLKRELAKDKRNTLLLKKLDFCEKAGKAIEKIKNDIMHGVRKELEETTSSTFLDFMELHGEKGTCTAVKILDDYSIKVCDDLGRQARGSLSVGQWLMLAYSYTLAVHSVSGFSTPIIIDTPMGGLDDDNKKIIAQYLPILLKGKQLTLLFRADEYTDDVRSALNEYIGKEYTMNKKEGITEIVLLRDNNV